MIPVSPALLGAASSWTFLPVATATVKDTQLRWQTLHNGTHPAPDSRVAQFSNGSYILRVRNNAGSIQYAKVNDPTQLAQWEYWTTITTGAHANSDVAVTWTPPFTWRVAYQTAAGALQIRTSTDHAATWSAPVTVCTPAVTPAYFALYGNILALQDTDVRYYYYTGGTWGGPTNTGLSITTPAGIAVAYNSTAALITTLAAHDGQLHYLPCNTSLPTITPSAGTVIAPPGDTTAATPPAPALPSICYTPDLTTYVATWIERAAPPLSLNTPLSATARVGSPHFGMHCPLADPLLSNQRWPVVVDTVGDELYAGGTKRILSVPNLYSPLRTPATFGPHTTLAYHMEAHHHNPGSLTVHILDPDNDYAAPGDQVLALRPLSTITVARGYTTAIGDETVTTPEHYIIAAHLDHQMLGGTLTIEAVDALGLLALWHPYEPQTYTNRSLGWLIAHIAGQVGLTVNDTATGTATTISTITLWPTYSGLVQLRHLLTLANATCTPTANRTLTITDTPRYSTCAGTLNANAEAKHAMFGIHLPGPTHHRVASDRNLVYSQLDNIARAQLIGWRLSTQYLDNNIDTQPLANQTAHALDTDAEMLIRSDSITVPLRPDVELHDSLNTYGTYPTPTSPTPRVVLHLVEDHEPRANLHQSTLTLGAIPNGA